MKANFNLTELAEGVPARISGITGGRRFQKKLESLGIRPGAIIKKLAFLKNFPHASSPRGAQLDLSASLSAGISIAPPAVCSSPSVNKLNVTQEANIGWV